MFLADGDISSQNTLVFFQFTVPYSYFHTEVFEITSIDCHTGVISRIEEEIPKSKLHTSTICDASVTTKGMFSITQKASVATLREGFLTTI